MAPQTCIHYVKKVSLESPKHGVLTSLHSNDIRSTAFVCLLVLDAPRTHRVSKVAAAVLDSSVITHAVYMWGLEKKMN